MIPGSIISILLKEESSGSSSDFTVDILSNTTSFNLTTTLTGLGWDGVSATDITINVASGITVGSTSIGVPGMTISLPGGSTVALNNEGRIQGRGGNGGRGQGSGTNGQGGGTALSTNVATTIDNLSGDIWGGGGGGGGGAGSTNFNPPGSGGGGGGGGAGTNPGTGGSGGTFSGGTAGQTGSTGTATSGGSGGAGGVNAGTGGSGGGPGLAGSNGQNKGSISGTSGGAAGKSIIGISNVTFTNAGDVRGPQSG